MNALSPLTWIILAGVLGLLVGSFLNVVILRLPARLDAAWRRDARQVLELPPDGALPPPGIVRERSHCPHCKHPLAARDNLPVLGWLLLRGRCRYCQAPISIQYPLVELLTGIASALVIWRFGVDLAGAAALVFTWMLVALSGIDFRTQYLPDQLTLPLLWLGLLLSPLPVFTDAPSAILGAALGYLSLWSVYWLFKLATGKEGMGYGDFKLLAAIGAWMGPLVILPVVLLSSVVGALLGGTLILLRRHGRDIPMPFGPFIALAGWVWLVAGGMLVQVWRAYAGTP